MNLAQLNHVLVPATAEQRKRARQSRLGRCLTPIFEFALATTPRGLVAILLTLVVGVLGLEVRNAQSYAVWCVLAGCMAGAAFGRRRTRIDGVETLVSLASCPTVGEPLCFRVTVVNRSNRAQEQVRIRGPFLPWDGKWEGPPIEIGRLLPGATQVVECFARFRERGEHHLESFFSCSLAPFGFFEGPPLLGKSQLRFVVCPKVPPVAHLALPPLRRAVGEEGQGIWGDGPELLGIRPYRRGDPVRLLHARNWARRGQPVVRHYGGRCAPRVGLWVDCTSEGSSEKQFEAGLSLAAGLSAAIAREGVGLAWLALGAQIYRFSPGPEGHRDALEVLGRARREPQGGGLRIEAELGVALDQVGGMILVFAGWDAPRERLETCVRQGGAPLRSFVVARRRAVEAARGRDRIPLTADRIWSGEPLWL